MIIKNAKFVKSSGDVSECPQSPMPEYAFIGRSNVGKSSLINMLCNRKKLALTSSTPGKTRSINHFLVDDSWYITDLPGYGYARRSKSERRVWQKMINRYFDLRENLSCVFVLIDARHEPQKNDLEFMQFLGEKEIAFVMVFTKIDKIGKMQLDNIPNVFEEAMKEQWEFLPEMFFTSATQKKGKEELLAFIEQTNKN